MKGTNELRLNTATMIEALQYWHDSKYLVEPKPRVTNVENNSGYSGGDFVVTLEVAEEE